MMKKLLFLTTLGLMLNQFVMATSSFCPTLKSTTFLPAFTNWKVLEVSPQRQPPIPPDLQTLCQHTCLVLESGEYSYWSYTYKNNSSRLVIIAYNRENQMMQRWDFNGALDSLVEININPMAQWIHFNGANHQQIIMSWQELTFYKKIVINQRGNQTFAEELPVKQNTAIQTKPISPPISNNNTAPSKLCLSATGAFSFEENNGQAGYCNDYGFSDSTVPCITAIKGNLKVGNCALNTLTPKPIPLMKLTFSKAAFIGSSFSAIKPRCDASSSYLETPIIKAPSSMSFVCFKYERETPSSFYYGLAFVNNGQIINFQFETTPDKCIGNCPITP